MLILLLILGFTPSAAAEPLGKICGALGNYTDESTYRANLGQLSKAFPKYASSTSALFAESSVGAVPDMVHGLALCSGDANASACAECVATAFQDAQRLCPYNKDTAVFYDACLLRFSNFAYDSRSEGPADGFLTLTNSTAPRLPGWDPAGDAEGVSTITGIIKLLLNETAAQAAWPAPYDAGLRVPYGTGHMYVSSTFPPLYAMAQCIPDEESITDHTACWDCLDNINVKFIARDFTGQQGGRVLGVQCHFRYETYHFYHGKPMRDIPWLGDAVRTPRLSVVPSQKHKKRMSKILVAATTVPLMAILFCSISGFAWNKRHGKGKASFHDEANINVHEDVFAWGLEGRNSEFSYFDFSQVLNATSNFSDESKLGQGGFGPVYKILVLRKYLARMILKEIQKGSPGHMVIWLLSMPQTAFSQSNLMYSALVC